MSFPTVCRSCGWQLKGAATLVLHPAHCPKCDETWILEPEVALPAKVLELAHAIHAVVWPANAYQTEEGRNARVDAVLELLERFFERVKV